MNWIFRILMAVSVFALTSCPKPEPVQPENPNDVSDIPWNAPAAGEGAGALQQALNPY